MEVERRKHEYHRRENKWNQNLALCEEQLTFTQIENLGEKIKDTNYQYQKSEQYITTDLTDI